MKGDPSNVHNQGPHRREMSATFVDFAASETAGEWKGDAGRRNDRLTANSIQQVRRRSLRRLQRYHRRREEHDDHRFRYSLFL